MILFGRFSLSIMVLYAVSLHIAWAIFLFIDPAATNATAVHALARWIHPPAFLACSVAAVGSAAALALVLNTSWIVWLLVPQQVFLMMSAAGAVEAIWLAQFADGVFRPRAFIAADQFYSILAAFWHTVAISAHALRVVR